MPTNPDPYASTHILCGADLGTQKQTSYLCELIEAKAIFNEAPRPVNDLRACLPSNGFTIRQLVSSQFDESRVFPHPLYPHFGAFLLVNYTIVQYTGHFGLVRTRAICMQNDFLAHKPLVRKWFPIHFANGSWARALAVVGGGVRRVRTNVSGRPRATRPAHCSQCAMESSTVLSNVASSASMSCQCGP